MKTTAHSKNDGAWRWTVIVAVLFLLATICLPAAADPLSQTRHVFINVSNTDGVKYDLDGAAYGGPNNTYYIKADGGGLNELHITADVADAYGQVTTSSNQSGVFYVSNTGGRGFDDDIILMFATNSSDTDFTLDIESSGYQWPFTYNAALPTSYTYNASALDESFDRDDLIYGLNTWKPSSVEDYPIFYGEDMYDDANDCAIMFIDLNVGALGVNSTLSSGGMARVNYTLNNFDGFCAFNAYAWCNWSNQGQGISWTNRVVDAGSSGYTVSL